MPSAIKSILKMYASQPKKTDLQVALRRLKKDYNAAVSIDNKSIFWDNYTDFTNGILTVRTFEDYNAYDTDKISYESYEAFKKTDV